MGDKKPYKKPVLEFLEGISFSHGQMDGYCADGGSVSGPVVDCGAGAAEAATCNPGSVVTDQCISGFHFEGTFGDSCEDGGVAEAKCETGYSH